MTISTAGTAIPAQAWARNIIAALSMLLPGIALAAPEEACEPGPAASCADASLRGRDFADRDLARASFYQADLSHAVLERADLGGADLRGANLEDANLRGADLRDADLRGTYLGGADLRGVNFEGARLEGADLTWALVNERTLFEAAQIEGCTACPAAVELGSGQPRPAAAPGTMDQRFKPAS